MKPFHRRTSRSEVSALLRVDLTPATIDDDLAARLGALTAQAPAPATTGRAFALRSGLGAVLAAGVTVVAGVGASYAVGVVDAPWAPPAETPSSPEPSERATTPAPPASGTPGSSERPASPPPASERNRGARGDEKGGPHRPTATPPHGKGKGPSNDRGRGNDRDRPAPTPQVRPTPDRGNDADPGQGRGKATDGRPRVTRTVPSAYDRKPG